MARKTTAPEEITIGELLDGIRSGTYYAEIGEAALKNGFNYYNTSISTAESLGIKIEDRYLIQDIKMPEKVLGNLRFFGGKSVEVICTTIKRGSAQIEMYVREF